ncbi:hypothetical protein [Sphingobacterium sp. DR205]|uniref:hypothetical protein n=1 Tax=Sphingobacterium sp. DR205 TaxID=2713573 RepID=UPI0013E44328|nr:hypothetical protein [Sphingobacterium sp. DR205]QIH35965.1 hypothetical protein G6053_25170 [Sphingobacterium sp. DR205]
MLNAESNSQPRQVNIGLPFNGDILILENDVPVVYSFWPTIPTTAWRYDNSLSRMGLLSFAESALLFGKVGFTVNSTDREAGSSFKGYASIYTNSFGSFRYDATVTGPLSKNGWGYMLSMFQAYDRGSGINYMYTPWQDRTAIIKAGISKKYKKGNIRLLYKYSDSRIQFSNYNPFIYEGDGKTRPLDGFKPGEDSYLVRDGKVPYYDPFNGKPGVLNLDDDKFNRSENHSLYINGTHKFDNGWKMNYSSMFQTANSPFVIQFPISLNIIDPDQQAGQQYKYQGTDKMYDGPVQFVSNQALSDSKVRTLISRVEFTNKVKGHDLRFGFTQQFNATKYKTYASVYTQTIEPNPSLLDMYAFVPEMNGYAKATNEFGAMPASAGGYGKISDSRISKVALYASDDFKLNKWLSVGLGARIEHQNIHEVYNPYINDFVMDRPMVTKDFKNKWNKVGLANFVASVAGGFGFLGDVTYNSWYDRYWDYPHKDANGNPVPDPSTPGAKPIQNVPNSFKTDVLNIGGGVYYNYGSLFSIVSKVTRITKNNILVGLNITNPANPAQRSTFDPLFYDISTLGWSTDIVTTPFKGFSLHYLLTLQKPQYKNFAYGAFGLNYNYSNNTIPELSGTLMEFDPSYSFLKGAMKVWVSLRYFGKQYGNQTNSIYYKGWWENFGGLDYRLSRNIDFKLQVTNFLNQRGVKGALQGADQIIDPTPYIGRKLVAGAIRPRTIEFTANFKL